MPSSPRTGDKARAAFDAISATGREAAAQLDRALGVLRSDGVARHPVPGLWPICRTWWTRSGSAGLDADLVVRGSPRPVPAELAAAVYRVVQEALTNTVKHAQAQRVSVASGLARHGTAASMWPTTVAVPDRAR